MGDSSKQQMVEGYFRKDGTPVRSHKRQVIQKEKTKKNNSDDAQHFSLFHKV